MADDARSAPLAPPSLQGYDQVSLLGCGGMATVWRARQIALDRVVAIKVLNPEQCQSDEDIDRFQSEARAAARMSHPGIVQVYDAFYRDGRFCFVMEFIDGRTVGEWIRRSGYLSEQEALFVADGVAAALCYAWERQDLVHCDIKPDNVMIDADGTVKVMDFGLSRSLCSLQARRAAAGADEYVFGTPAYMAPEQATGDPSLSVQADMYALGALLYHACTGRRLFQGVPTDGVMSAQVNDQDEAPLVLNASLSPHFCDLLERLLAKSPADRFADWNAVVAALAAVRAGRPFAEGPLDPQTQRSTVRHCDAVDRLRRERTPPSAPAAGNGTDDVRTARAHRAALRIHATDVARLSEAAGRRGPASSAPFVRLLVIAALCLAVSLAFRYLLRPDDGRRRGDRLVESLAEWEGGLRSGPLEDLADIDGALAYVRESRLRLEEAAELDPARRQAAGDRLAALQRDLEHARVVRIDRTLRLVEATVSWPSGSRSLRNFQGHWDKRGSARRGARAAAECVRRYAGPNAGETSRGRDLAAQGILRAGAVR